MKTAIKKAIITAALAAASFAAAGQDISDKTKEEKPAINAAPSNLEWHFAQGNDKARINLFYNLPLKTDGYSFMEFYGKGGYFGKTMLYTPFDETGMGFKTETSHALFTNPEGKDVSYNKIGFGLEQKFTIPGKINASMKALPLVFGNGAINDMEVILGYCASKTVPVGKCAAVTLSSFLDFSVKSHQKMVSDYGETAVTFSYKTKAGQVDASAGWNHDVSGKLAPNNHFRVGVAYHPFR